MRQPLFTKCDRVQATTAWAGIIANVILVVWCTLWLGTHCSEVSPSAYTFPLDLLFALFVADLFSGFVHWISDTWFDEIKFERIISIAREHHIYPQHILGYGFRDYVAYSSWPAVVVLGPLVLVLTFFMRPSSLSFAAVLICAIVAGIMFFGSHAHRLGHKKADAWILKRLQAAHLIMSPRHHGVHHRGNHDIRYCVINGWANDLCDLIGFWRALEKLVSWTTGAVPRSNDREWFVRFQNIRLSSPWLVGGRDRLGETSAK